MYVYDDFLQDVFRLVPTVNVYCCVTTIFFSRHGKTETKKQVYLPGNTSPVPAGAPGALPNVLPYHFRFVFTTRLKNVCFGAAASRYLYLE